jgi:predicted ATPase/DNA-binding SARP family transcriptional activator
MRFGILGQLQVRRGDGREVTVGGRRLRALLALLLVDAGKVVPPERLIDELYGGNPPSDAGNALQSQVSRLRGLLREEGRPGPLVELHPGGYRLVLEADEVDAHRFEQLAAEGRRALAAGDRARAVSLLREALGLWRGPALADLGEVTFARAQAVRLEELRVSAVEDRAEAELALGGHPTLVAELERSVAAYPLRERLRGLLMRALYAAGRQAEALTVFEEARRTLAEELGADPSAELAAVHLAVLRADPSLAGPAQRGEVPRQGLPAQLTSFVGRAEEVRRVARLLGETRLVTLTGPGGAGKTRMAIEAAGREPGAVCFVELAPVGEGADVPLAVLGALGVRDARLLPPRAPNQPGPPSDSTERLVAALADRPMLLVLDNCEHVIEAAARLTHHLLSACPMLRVLATSREALGITGETVWPVPPLALPPRGAASSEALVYPAVRLFADRAAAVWPDFAVDAVDTEAVVRICRTLDGLPLAIELAAARLRSLSLAEIASRLDDRFALLSRGDRTAAPRHQTLRAAVEWSWDLLSDAEQTLARQLAVFAGAATLQAAERVCGLPAAEAGELLASLVEKSLVDAVGENERRYRMLETVRAFCAERLAEAGEMERLRRAHAAFFLDLAQTADRHLRSSEQLEWLGRLDVEHADLTAALRRSIDAAEVGPALRLLAALASYWWLRGRRGEGAVLAGDLLDRIGPDPPAGLEEEYALCVLHVAVGGSAGPELRAHLEAAQSIVYTMGRPARQPFLAVLSAAASGPMPQEDVRLDPTRQRYLTSPDPWIRALARLGNGYELLAGGKVTEAEREFAGALARFRALGERWGTGMVLAELAALADRRGDRERFVALTDQALDLAEQLDAADDVADLLCRRAGASVHAGDLAGAQTDYGRAAELARLAGTAEQLAEAHRGLGEIARLRGDLDEARRLCELALDECPAGWYIADEIRMGIMVALGRVAEAEGDAGAARGWYRRALAALGLGWFAVEADAAEGLAGVALLEGDGDRAALLLGVGAALRGASVPGDPHIARVSAEARARIGEAAYQRAYQRGAAMTRDQALALLGAPPSASGA